MFDIIDKQLESNFVQTEKIAHVFKLSLVSGKGLILYGEAGHGKSEMGIALQECLSDDISSWKKQLTVESTVSSLFGGIDMVTLQKSGKEWFNVKGGMSDSHIAILEEMLDAPGAVLASLKSLLTEKRVLNGDQVVPSKIMSIIAMTNKPPIEFAGIGPSEKAILERFPIQVEVKTTELHSPRVWGSIIKKNNTSRHRVKEEDKITLDDLKSAQKTCKRVKLSRDIQKTMSLLICEIGKEQPISPRIGSEMVSALIKAQSTISGRDYVEYEDLKVMKYVMMVNDDKFDQIFFDIVELNKKLSADTTFLREYENKFEELRNKVNKEIKKGSGFNSVTIVESLKTGTSIKNGIMSHEFLEQSKGTRDNLISKVEAIQQSIYELLKS